VESEALGTGGAIKKALASISEQESLIVNGDTLFDIDIPKFTHFAKGSNGVACLALRQVEDCSRYGRVTTDKNGRIMTFGEKGHPRSGLINGGIYYLRNHALEEISFKTFSFEISFCKRSI
jgi:D-glycero-alpha-D-manno-heptose 1-phosphate guanylyltransferase